MIFWIASNELLKLTQPAEPASLSGVLGVPPSVFGVPCGTDLRLFTRHANIPTVLYGPGNVIHAHAADEFVSLSQVIACTKVLARTMMTWCGT